MLIIGERLSKSEFLVRLKLSLKINIVYDTKRLSLVFDNAFYIVQANVIDNLHINF